MSSTGTQATGGQPFVPMTDEVRAEILTWLEVGAQGEIDPARFAEAAAQWKDRQFRPAAELMKEFMVNAALKRCGYQMDGAGHIAEIPRLDPKEDYGAFTTAHKLGEWLLVLQPYFVVTFRGDVDAI